MIRSAVTVSLVDEARGGPFVFSGDLGAACDRAQKLGFDAIELFPPGPDVIPPKRFRLQLNDHGLTLAAVGTGAGWVKHRLHLVAPDPGVRAEARGFLRSMIDYAGAMHAPAIIGSMQGRSSPEIARPTALGYLADALEDLGEHARQYDVPLLYEPLNRYETDVTNTLDAAGALLGSLSTTNVKILADLFHMNIEETDLPEAIRAAGSRIGHVHFVDSNRRAAGTGHIDFVPIAEALADIQFSGFASAEALPLPNPEAAAAQTIETFRRTFGAPSQ